jgi:hypothetical protein
MGIAVDLGVSATTLKRLVLSQALARLPDGTAEGLLMLKVDRVTRSRWDVGELIERDVHSGRPVSTQIDTRTAVGRWCCPSRRRCCHRSRPRERCRTVKLRSWAPAKPSWITRDPRMDVGGVNGGAQRCGEGGRGERRWHLPPARHLVVPTRGGSIGYARHRPQRGGWRHDGRQIAYSCSGGG